MNFGRSITSTPRVAPHIIHRATAPKMTPNQPQFCHRFPAHSTSVSHSPCAFCPTFQNKQPTSPHARTFSHWRAQASFQSSSKLCLDLPGYDAEATYMLTYCFGVSQGVIEGWKKACRPSGLATVSELPVTGRQELSVADGLGEWVLIVMGMYSRKYRRNALLSYLGVLFCCYFFLLYVWDLQCSAYAVPILPSYICRECLTV